MDIFLHFDNLTSEAITYSGFSLYPTNFLLYQRANSPTVAFPEKVSGKFHRRTLIVCFYKLSIFDLPNTPIKDLLIKDLNDLKCLYKNLRSVSSVLNDLIKEENTFIMYKIA